MVLESLLNPVAAERRPYLMVFLGFLYSTVAIFLANWIFAEYASLVMVFLTVLACAPLMYRTIKLEEKKDVIYDSEKKIMWEHAKALDFMLFLFLGITLSYTLWYIALPLDLSTATFSIQSETIARVNSNVTGNIISGLEIFSRIFLNNLKVMIFCLLFSLTFGLGAIFILVWNASVIGVALGDFIRDKLSIYAGSMGFTKLAAYFHVTSWGLLRYGIHGVPEILAYFVAGLAGGIISIAIIKHDFGTKRLEKILLDTSDLILIAVGLLFLGAVIETYITPFLF